MGPIYKGNIKNVGLLYSVEWVFQFLQIKHIYCVMKHYTFCNCTFVTVKETSCAVVCPLQDQNKVLSYEDTASKDLENCEEWIYKAYYYINIV